ncbi:MAG: hypothetical protein O7C61_08860 [SAR324 cluster bacterium]|nr:hypothetical protein [SAR324 cluster bacterium]
MSPVHLLDLTLGATPDKRHYTPRSMPRPHDQRGKFIRMATEKEWDLE